MQTRAAAVAVGAGKPLEVTTVEIAPRARAECPGRDQGDGHLPYRRIHAFRRRSEGIFPGDPGHEGAASWWNAVLACGR